MQNWDIDEKARKFHYWRGFFVGAVAGGVAVFLIMGTCFVYMFS